MMPLDLVAEVTCFFFVVLAKSKQILAGPNSGLAHQHPGILHQIEHAEGMRKIGGHGVQIAIIDPEQRIARMRETDVIEHAAEIVDRVDFDQGRHPQFGGEDLEIDHLTLAQTFGDQQDRVGPRRPGFPDLIFVDDEVFSEHRKRHPVLDPLDESEIASEVMLVGEATDRRRPARVVAFGDVGRIEVLPDHARGGALALHFGDHAKVSRFSVGHHRPKEVSWPLQVRDAILDRLERGPRSGFFHFDPLSGHDLVEHAGHDGTGYPDEESERT